MHECFSAAISADHVDSSIPVFIVPRTYLRFFSTCVRMKQAVSYHARSTGHELTIA